MDATTHGDPLAQLGAHLGARGFTVDLTGKGLKVVNTKVVDEAGTHPSDSITCRSRETDGGRMWFFTSWDEPIAEADHVIDASVIVMGNLAGRPEEGRR